MHRLATMSPSSERKVLVRYAFAIGVMIMSVLIRLVLNPVLEQNIPYVTIFPAIVIVSVFSGMGPSILASILGILAAEILFIEDITVGIAVPGVSFVVRAAILLISGILIGWFGSNLAEARRRVMSNVAAAKKAEEALIESYARLDRSQEMAHLGSWELDLVTNVLTWSDEAYRIFGLHPQEFKATYDAFLAVVHPDDRAIVNEAYTSSVREGKNSYDIEHRIVRTDGTVRIVHEKCEHIRDAAGTIIRSVGMVHDITEYRHAMDALRRSEEAKNNFITTLAHELRNPLSPILARAELLRTSNGQASTSKDVNDALVYESVTVIERQAKTLQRLVDDLLDVSRIEHGKIVLHKEPTDLAAAVSRALENVSAAGNQLDHAITTSLPPIPVWISADPVRIDQILTNLLANAVKYTQPKGAITISVIREGNDAVISVKDNGIGIAPEHMEAIFELFSYAAKPFTQIGGDLGIGLHVTRNLVHLHGGSIHVASERGKGSEFSVRLPALPEGFSPPTNHAEPPVNNGKRKKILVVDDNTDAAISLGKLLSLYGHDIQLAHDGKSAITAAALYAPQLVLLDIGLPDMDGYAVAQALRKAHGNDLRIVALTGYGQEEDKAKAVRAGFDRHLVKPVSGAILQSVIAEL